MLISKTSPLTGCVHSMEIAVDAIELLAYLDGFDPRPIQAAFPTLTPEEREFIMTGVTTEEWNAFLGDEPDTLH